jgi:DNA-binding PadR family transcriptional regulator
VVKTSSLGDFEQLVMLALLRIGDGAYGMVVRREIEKQTGREISLGAVYATLDRLESKGMVRSTIGSGDPSRRGRAKRFFNVEPLGLEVLSRSLAALDRMRADLVMLERLEEVNP